MQKYEIKTLTQSDVEEFCRVRLKSLEQYPAAFSMMPQMFIDAPLEAKLAKLKDSEGSSPDFINGIFINERLIGIIGFLVSARGSVSHKGTMWGFYIEPEYQSKGYGRKLLVSYIEKIKAMKNIKQHRLMTAVSGESALKLFESVRFIKYGQEPFAISDGRKFIDQYYYYMLNE